MKKVSIWKVVMGLVVIALLVGAGGMIFRAGYARGVMSDVSFEEMPFADGNYEGMMPYGGHYGMRGYYGYSHFSFGRMLFGGFVFFLFVGAMFRFFGMRRYGYGMPPWAMHKMHRAYGREGKGGPWMHHDHPCWDEKKSDDEDEAEEESEA
ncbi:MAG: hypothetical protein HN736_02825 [Anaerolineae bacterium]|jgi:hypothetical protein|nr:hypothetical protein [Anaerolineae bacterium]MBT3712063.1 hypothetical protein [Anaerolineae bacterium]MBT4308918.1 hypothetical protein [Anaerolineae bacterium]MBT4458802.1 hypothetical protein [Anaerolineae bacterium]MBT4841259.1 hypothetical protein [Anaerolineae bacterium]